MEATNTTDFTSSPQAFSTSGENSTLSSAGTTLFNGHSVSHQPPSPVLSVYLDSGHSFIRLQYPQREIDVVRGFYPRKDENSDMDTLSYTEGGYKASASTYSHKIAPQAIKPAVSALKLGAKSCLIAMKKPGLVLPGQVLDEETAYRNHKDFKETVPHIDFPIHNEEAERIYNHIDHVIKKCFEGRSCQFTLLQNNCIDFSQSVFEKTYYSGHFVDHFPTGLATGLCPAFASLANSAHPPALTSQVTNAISHQSTIILLTIMIRSIVPAAASGITSAFHWLTGRTKGTEQQDPPFMIHSQLRKKIKAMKKTVLAIDRQPIEDTNQNKPLRSELIHLSVEIQSRFDQLEKYQKRYGRQGKHALHISKELDTINGLKKAFKERFFKYNHGWQ